MRDVWLAALVAGAWIASAWLTGVAREYALRRALLDIPNERSSHQVPTPRGGGIAIASVMAAGIAVLGFGGVLDGDIAWALLGGGAMVAGIGWLDDHRHVAPPWRALVHLLAAVWALYWLGDFTALPRGETSGGWASLHVALAALAIVWLINLYNFMDGIDGLAGIEAATAGVGGAVLLSLGGAPGLAMVTLLMAASCAGFLWWNWPPAKIFMGDIGSGLLGYCFAVVALAGEGAGVMPAAVWLLLLAVFVLDASFTLVRRVLAGERWYTAHRSHAYQRLVQLGHSHRRVSLGVAGINMLLLFPAAALSMLYPASLPVSLLIAAVAGWLAWSGVQRRYHDANVTAAN